MHYTKLSVAGCAALMFGLIACSGEDGKDGVNGVNGLNGADGASCEVKSLKDESGYKVLCGGDSVGVLLNGKTGATGKQGIAGATGAKGDTGKTGESCTVEPITDGYKVLCGNKEVGTLKNGTNGTNGESCKTSTADNGIVITCPNQTPVTLTNGVNGVGCSGKSVTNEKTGLHGVAITCGSTKDTIWDGAAAAAGSECTRTDKGDGTVTVKCGDAEAFTIYKAMCGADSYDPEKKFCVLGKTYDLCNGKAYVVNREFCNDGVIDTLCAEYKLNKDLTKASLVQFRALEKDEFCWNGFIMPKCGGKEFGMNEFCDKTYDGKQDSIHTYCRNEKDDVLEAIYQGIGLSLWPQEAEEDDDVTTPKQNFFGDLIGKPLQAKNDDDAVLNFFVALNDIVIGNTDCGMEVQSKCGGKVYNPNKQFCDKRDDHIYKYVTIDGRKWMAENLAFEYKLPKKVAKKITPATATTPADTVFSLDNVGGELKYETTVYENYPATEGRYYTWNSAMGVDDLRKILADEGKLDAQNLDAIEMVYGACPDGWMVPTQADLENLSTMANGAIKGFADLDDDDNKLVNFNMKFLGYYDADAKEVSDSEKAYFWSATDVVVDEDQDQAYGMIATDLDASSVKTSNKKYAFTIRCVEAVN